MLNLINRLFRKTWFPLVFQLLSLIVFILLIIGGLSANTDDPIFAKVLRNTNLSNLIVWSYWWSLIILSAMLFGRVWCTVCPMELISSLASKFGLKRTAPRFLRSGWFITIFYVLILFVGIHTLSIHRVPYLMAIYMLILFGTVIVFGLIYSRNAFCAYVCPVGHLLGLYSRLAPFAWGVRNKSVCSDCSDKSCVSKKTAYNFQGRSCGVGLYPGNIEDDSQCIVCGQCTKACDRNNPGDSERPNPAWFSRPWFSGLLNLKPLSPAQMLFSLIVSGFVIYEVFSEWSVTKEILSEIPAAANHWLNTGAEWKGLIKSLTLFVLLPLVFWLLPFGLFRSVGGRLSISDYLLRFGISFIPIMAAAHAVKAVLKMTSRIPYWDHVFSDPTGTDTAQAILDKTLVLSSIPAWREPLITVLALLLMTGGVVLSIFLIRKLISANLKNTNFGRMFMYLIPVLYGGLFLVGLIAWRY